MRSSPASTITTRLCMGIPITTEIQLLLSKSTHWKLTNIQALPGELIQIPYQGKNYLGCYLPEQQSLGDLEKISAFIKSKFQSYCPNYRQEEIKICVFAQVLIA